MDFESLGLVTLAVANEAPAAILEAEEALVLLSLPAALGFALAGAFGLAAFGFAGVLPTFVSGPGPEAEAAALLAAAAAAAAAAFAAFVAALAVVGSWLGMGPSCGP